MPSGFPYHLPYKRLNLRKHPELYRIGKGEQGVLMIEPYKSELLPFWRFKDPEISDKSAGQLTSKFNEYKAQNDFVGMDMARKYIQMGFTRSRRYANHKSGRKYEKDGDRTILPQTDPTEAKSLVKARSAENFRQHLEQIKKDEKYIQLTARHKEKYEHKPIPKDTSQFEEGVE